MVIISRKSGRMGNRLFTFAHFMANAMEYGPYTINNPVFNEYSAFFVGTDRHWMTRFPSQDQAGIAALAGVRRFVRKVLDYLLYSVTNPLRGDRIAFLHSPIHEVIDLHNPAVYEWWRTGYLQFVRRKLVVSSGWIFWDHENFIKHAPRIREYFRLVPALENRVRKHVAICRSEGVLLVGIHIRHGDYRTAGGGGYFYETAQYADLMRRTAEVMNQPVRFLVCSDEPVRPEDFAGLDIRTGPGAAIEDMYALAACDYIMGPPSSFSGWASYYGQVPLYFITDMNQALSSISRADFVPLNSFDCQVASHRYEGPCPKGVKE